MKDWQHGYDLDWLKEKENHFADYNKVVLSPFAQMKKNKIAGLLSEDKLLQIDNISGETILPTNVARNAVHVRAYGNVDLGIRQKGERLIDNPVGDKKLLIKTINTFKENIWMMINSEYKLGNEIAKELKFKKIGIKVNSFSDIINVYVRQNSHLNMDIRKLPKIETINIKKVGGIAKANILQLQKRIKELDNLFTNHYSNYNKKKSWSALALKGYDSDPVMIEKPSEMNDKWQKEHVNFDFYLQETELMYDFIPTINYILKMIPAETERIRLMKLEPNGGELDRHTDQTDKDLGTQDGDIMRLHIPIITNDKMLFHSWDSQGKETINNMKEGEIWYLDIRKPHRAVNGGDKARIHLVIDVIVNQNIRGLVVQS